ncbi:hypothetical protein NNX28_02045 [Arthrobacter sp. zg-Y859]|uniref:Uncharacterized protein n=1 Tax=Arthrobacter jinronghuae TaxID=2964609 RepID=A0ABT1NLW4_9MICC|nr:hypothetical protein [Arthrobacter jinronghuae]MCQ1948710.1 hypothetical protein [Arthrobacter jinronghuae]UWX78477.1 hypothetical protein N2K98_16220 [Arthrobacter jinronghuae]
MTTVSLSVNIQRKKLLPWQRPDTVFKTRMDVESVDISEAPVAGVYEPGSEYSGESLRIRGGHWFVSLGQDAREVIDLSAHIHGLSRTKDQSAAEEAARSAADEFLVIAGTVWKKIGEPYYEIIDSRADGERGTTILANCNANSPVEDTAYCYGADEREQAAKDAADLADRRGRSKEVCLALQDFAGIAVTPEAVLTIRHGIQPDGR